MLCYAMLMKATLAADAKRVQLLLSRGENTSQKVDMVDGLGRSALHLCVSNPPPGTKEHSTA